MRRLGGLDPEACGALRFDRSSYHYKFRRTDPAELKRRIRKICETRMRYGYRRVHVVLMREGWEVRIKKVYSVYRALGLQLRNMTPKRRVKAKLRDDRVEAAGPNDVWAMDLVHDQLALGDEAADPHDRRHPFLLLPGNGRPLPVLGEDVVQTLERVCRKVGYRRTIRVDNGSEFVSRDVDLWAYARQVILDFSRPGKPTDNGFIKAFNSKLRAECLNAR